jgi:acyl-CoA thioester hydrolase
MPSEPIVPRFNLEAYRGVTHPWHCDAMGHVNVRHYMAIFDDAAFQMLGVIAGGSHLLAEKGLGWADVRHTIEYRRELEAGALVVVRAALSRIGRTSVTVDYTLLDAMSEDVHATLEAITVLFDLKARVATPLPDYLRRRAEEMQASV